MQDDLAKSPTPEKLSPDEAAMLTAQIALLSESGLPLGPGLRATSEELPSGRLKQTLAELADSIDRGEPLDIALNRRVASVPAHVRGIVLAGLKSGKLSLVLGQFVTLSSVGIEIRRKLWIGMLYPLTAIIIALGILVFGCAWLVLSFSTIFNDFGIQLPRLTAAIISISEFLVQKGPPLMILALLLIAAPIISRIFLKTSQLRGLLTHIPLVGRVWKSTALAEFFHMLALLLECEIPLTTAIQLTGGGVENREIERACEGMSLDVSRGMALSEAVKQQKFFPKGIVRILKWAEGHQSLPETLHMTGDILISRANVEAGFAGTTFTILAMLSILFGIGAVVLGLFIPLISLISKLSG